MRQRISFCPDTIRLGMCALVNSSSHLEAFCSSQSTPARFLVGVLYILKIIDVGDRGASRTLGDVFAACHQILRRPTRGTVQFHTSTYKELIASLGPTATPSTVSSAQFFTHPFKPSFVALTLHGHHCPCESLDSTGRTYSVCVADRKFTPCTVPLLFPSVCIVAF